MKATILLFLFASTIAEGNAVQESVCKGDQVTWMRLAVNSSGESRDSSEIQSDPGPSPSEVPCKIATSQTSDRSGFKDCNQRGNKKDFIWLDSQWVLDMTSSTTVEHNAASMTAYEQYITTGIATWYPKIVKTAGGDADACIKEVNTAIASTPDYCDGAIANKGSPKHTQAIASWISAFLKPVNDFMADGRVYIDGEEKDCGFVGGKMGIAVEHVKDTLAKTGRLWERNKGRCSKAEAERAACQAKMGISPTDYSKSNSGKDEDAGARLGTIGWEEKDALKLKNEEGKCVNQQNFWNCNYWTGGAGEEKHNFPHGLASHVRNSLHLGDHNPSEIMRNFDVPFLGGPSGSIMDRVFSAIALSYESQRHCTAEKSCTKENSYVISNLGGIAVIETIALVGGGHHSLAEVLLGAYATTRGLDMLVEASIDKGLGSDFSGTAVNSVPPVDPGELTRQTSISKSLKRTVSVKTTRTLLEEEVSSSGGEELNQLAMFIQDKGFVTSLAESGFFNAEISNLYDAMEAYEGGEEEEGEGAHATRSGMHRAVLCNFIKKTAPDMPADKMCEGITEGEDCKDEYLKQGDLFS